ncbi:MAG: AgmX/PglI C-terminal domain-containing protein [Deltaproteobacteria bacterium]|nr:AgmX/PglI C-terminal domain-containing protein [Deltaproteobacteria bacterium]
MSHRIRERKIFAYLDGRLDPSKKKKLLSHLKACGECEAYLKRVERIRDLTREVSEISDPNWRHIDPIIEAGIANATARPQHIPVWAPVALALTAVAAVTLAVMLPIQNWSSLKPDVNVIEKPRLALSALSHAPRESRIAPPLSAQVIDTLRPDQPPKVGDILQSGYKAVVMESGSVRVALDSSALLDLGERTSWEILSLNADRPAIALHHGRLLVSVSPFSFTSEYGLEILAAGASYFILDGIAEFVFQGNTAIINLIEGEVLGDSNLGPFSLDPGIWKTAVAEGTDESYQWISIGSLGKYALGDVDETRPTNEQTPRAHKSGTLPKHIIREVLEPSKAKIRACYEKALKRNPNLSLLLDARLRVGRGGDVASIELEGLDDVPVMHKCVEDVLRVVNFPPPRGGPLKLVLPLRLYPAK